MEESAPALEDDICVVVRASVVAERVDEETEVVEIAD